MGTAVIGGTAAASVIAIFLSPVAFFVVGKLSGRRKRRKDLDESGAYEINIPLIEDLPHFERARSERKGHPRWRRRRAHERKGTRKGPDEWKK
jgi:hypothetical protein